MTPKYIVEYKVEFKKHARTDRFQTDDPGDV